MDMKILLADDHKLMREGLRTLISEQENMSVIAEAENGDKAINLARTTMPDVVIMDISMPGTNGIEATRRIVSAHPSIKVIALSMHLDKRMILEMFRAGVDAYLLKDCAFDEVITAINSVSSGSGYISPRAAAIIIKDYDVRIRQKELPELPGLNKRETDLLELLRAGKEMKQVASLLQMSANAAESQRRALVLKRLIPHLNKADSSEEELVNGALTTREKEILMWVKEGKHNKDIASIMGITSDTVKYHLKNIFLKLNVSNRSQAISVALEHKQIEL